MVVSPERFRRTRERLFHLLNSLSYEYRDNPFKLKSGRESHTYFDVRKTSTDGEGAVYIGDLFMQLTIRHARQALGIGGLTLGADPLVMATVMASRYKHALLSSGFFVRDAKKGHGIGSLVVGASKLHEGTPVVICDDVITSGGSMLEAARIAREERGFVPVLALAVIDREEDGGRERIEAEIPLVIPLFTRSEFESGQLSPHRFV